MEHCHVDNPPKACLCISAPTPIHTGTYRYPYSGHQSHPCPHALETHFGVLKTVGSPKAAIAGHNLPISPLLYEEEGALGGNSTQRCNPGIGPIRVHGCVGCGVSGGCGPTFLDGPLCIAMPFVFLLVHPLFGALAFVPLHAWGHGCSGPYRVTGESSKGKLSHAKTKLNILFIFWETNPHKQRLSLSISFDRRGESGESWCSFHSPKGKPGESNP